jgi:acyl-CoA thioester hydrolase
MNDPLKEPFSIPVRVTYADTDQMGMVYHANYLIYFEMGRTELLRAYGFPYARMEAMGVLLPVIEAHCSYRTPARYDDLLTVESVPSLANGIRLRIFYALRRDGELLATGYTDHVCVGRDGKPQRMHPELRGVIEQAIAERGAEPPGGETP